MSSAVIGVIVKLCEHLGFDSLLKGTSAELKLPPPPRARPVAAL